MLLGHKGRCFDIRINNEGNRAISASEDGTSRIWDLQRMVSTRTFTHDIAAEVLRAIFLEQTENTNFITCGSNGKAIIWSNSGEKISELLHMSEQIYVCEEIHRQSQLQLLTADDEAIYLWDFENPFGPVHRCVFNSATLADTAFGGPRNPDGKIYIFDAKFSPLEGAANMFATALSDGTVRVKDVRNIANDIAIFSPQDLAGRTGLGHVTSVAWNRSGDTLLASVGSGDILLIDLRMNRTRAQLQGHKSTCFGTLNLPTQSTNLGLTSSSDGILSWSSDTSIKVWDINAATGVVSTYTNLRVIDDYPIYNCCLSSNNRTLLCAGGSSSNKSFLGTPLHSLDLSSLDNS